MFLNWGLGLLGVYKIIRQFESELMQTHERGANRWKGDEPDFDMAREAFCSGKGNGAK